jgi:hypothetical protein
MRLSQICVRKIRVSLTHLGYVFLQTQLVQTSAKMKYVI